VTVLARRETQRFELAALPAHGGGGARRRALWSQKLPLYRPCRLVQRLGDCGVFTAAATAAAAAPLCTAARRLARRGAPLSPAATAAGGFMMHEPSLSLASAAAASAHGTSPALRISRTRSEDLSDEASTRRSDQKALHSALAGGGMDSWLESPRFHSAVARGWPSTTRRKLAYLLLCSLLVRQSAPLSLQRRAHAARRRPSRCCSAAPAG